MALSDHLRELRARLIRSVLVLVIAVFCVALFFYDQLSDLILVPYDDAGERLQGHGRDRRPSSTTSPGRCCSSSSSAASSRLIASSPYWLYQIWAFILPGLHATERKWSRIFAAIAGPLFFAGVADGLLRAAQGDRGADRLHPRRRRRTSSSFGQFFSFITRMLLVFGIAFEIPLFVVMLNLAGVVSGKALGRYRPWIIIGTFVFAAVATPSTDPFSMLFLAVPDAGAVRDRRGHRPARRPGPRPRRGLDRAVGRRRGLDAVTDARAGPLRPARLAGGGPGLLGHRPGARRTPRRRLPHRRGRTRRCPATCSPSTRPTRRPCSTRPIRTRVHQTWRHGQVLLLTRDGRATVAAPGTSWTADRVLEALTRRGPRGRCRPGRCGRCTWGSASLRRQPSTALGSSDVARGPGPPRPESAEA